MVLLYYYYYNVLVLFIVFSLLITSLALPSPTIAIVSRRSLDQCGEVMTLNCSTNQLRNLFTSPTITWIAPDGSEIPRVENNDRQIDPQTGHLIFRDVTPNNRGRYTCHTIIDIPEAQIYNHHDEATVQVNTDCE